MFLFPTLSPYFCFFHPTLAAKEFCHFIWLHLRISSLGIWRALLAFWPGVGMSNMSYFTLAWCCGDSFASGPDVDTMGSMSFDSWIFLALSLEINKMGSRSTDFRIFYIGPRSRQNGFQGFQFERSLEHWSQKSTKWLPGVLI